LTELVIDGAGSAERKLIDLSRKSCMNKKEIIEAALAESKGESRAVPGRQPSWESPRPRLESKIKLLKIKKNQFKTE